MASRSCSCAKEASINDLPYSVISIICSSLDTDQRGWETLAGECGYSFHEIQIFGLEYNRHSGSPARCLFQDLACRNKKSGYLYDKLHKCNRRREMTLLAPYLITECKCDSDVNDHDNGGASGPYSSTDSNNNGGNISSDIVYDRLKNQNNYLPVPKPPFQSKPDLMKNKDINFNNSQAPYETKAPQKNLADLDIKQSEPIERKRVPESYTSLPGPISSTDNESNGLSQFSHSLGEVSSSCYTPYSSNTSKTSSHQSSSVASCSQSHMESKQISLKAEDGGGKTGATSLNPDCSSTSDTLQLTSKELSVATEGFSEKNKIGEGAFGTVYKGCWRHSDVAVKKLFSKPNSENEKFRNHLSNEIKTLGKYRHENIVLLYGYLIEDFDVCLVYQFMENGSVEDRLQHKPKINALPWDIRIAIAVGAARGLQYLHTMDSSRPVIHGDIKSANILLDKHMVAKIGDFGLAQQATGGSCTDKLTHITKKEMDTKLFGTKAYLPPEFHSSAGQVSIKTDTFSFGVVLLELCTGLKAYDEKRQKGKFLSSYIDTMVDDHELTREKSTGEWMKVLKDSNVDISEHEEGWSFKRMVLLALLCNEKRKKDRPTMEQVYERLEEHRKDWDNYMKTNLRSSSQKPSITSCHGSADGSSPVSLHVNMQHASGFKSPRSASPMENLQSINQIPEPLLLQAMYDRRQDSLHVDCEENEKSDPEHIYQNIDDIERYPSDPKKLMEIDKFDTNLDTNVDDPIYEVIENIVRYPSDPEKVASIEKFDNECDYQPHPKKLSEIETIGREITNSFNKNQFNENIVGMPSENTEKDSLTDNCNKLEMLLNEAETLKSFEKIDINYPYKMENCDVCTSGGTASINSSDYVSEVTYQMGHDNENTVICKDDVTRKCKPKQTKKMHDFFDSYTSLSKSEGLTANENACENSDMSGFETELPEEFIDTTVNNPTITNMLDPQEDTWEAENDKIIHYI